MGGEPVTPRQRFGAEAGRPVRPGGVPPAEPHRAEIGILKWPRRVATQYEKLAIHYLEILKLAILFRFCLA